MPGKNMLPGSKPDQTGCQPLNQCNFIHIKSNSLHQITPVNQSGNRLNGSWLIKVQFPCQLDFSCLELMNKTRSPPPSIEVRLEAFDSQIPDPRGVQYSFWQVNPVSSRGFNHPAFLRQDPGN